MAPCGVAAAPHVRHGVGLATQSRVARKGTGVQGLTSATGLAAGRGDVRGSVHPLTRSGAAVTQVSLSEALALGPAGSLDALLPVRLCRQRFHRVGVQAVTWAVGDVGCPDELDAAAVPTADMSALAVALAALPWKVLVFTNLAEGALNAERLCAALETRGHAVRHHALWPCPQLELPESWDAYLATLSPNRRQ